MLGALSTGIELNWTASLACILSEILILFVSMDDLFLLIYPSLPSPAFIYGEFPNVFYVVFLLFEDFMLIPSS